MGGLYDAATLRALLVFHSEVIRIKSVSFLKVRAEHSGSIHGPPCHETRVRFPGWRECRGCHRELRRLVEPRQRCGTAVLSPRDRVLLVILHALRTSGVEPGSQAWEACMMLLHYVRLQKNLAEKMLGSQVCMRHGRPTPIRQ